MNAYILVEGKRCERKLYPAWLSAIAPHLQQVKDPNKIASNNYFLFSGEGYPSILDVHLGNAIRDIEKVGRFNFLIVALDSDEDSAAAREEAVIAAAENATPALTTATLEVVIQHRCIETWLLANRRIFVRNPENYELRNYIEHYDARQLNPEDMPKPPEFNTHAQFHYAYLRAIFEERKISYTKTRPGEAATAAYLEQIMSRAKDCPDHIKSFSRFLDICRKLS